MDVHEAVASPSGIARRVIGDKFAGLLPKKRLGHAASQPSRSVKLLIQILFYIFFPPTSTPARLLS
jgi:hypothetical protein